MGLKFCIKPHEWAFLFKVTSFWCLAVVVLLTSLETMLNQKVGSGLIDWPHGSKRLSGVTECVKDFQCQTTLVPPAALFMPAVPGIKRHYGRLHAAFLSPLTLQHQTFIWIHIDMCSNSFIIINISPQILFLLNFWIVFFNCLWMFERSFELSHFQTLLWNLEISFELLNIDLNFQMLFWTLFLWTFTSL